MLIQQTLFCGIWFWALTGATLSGVWGTPVLAQSMLAPLVARATPVAPLSPTVVDPLSPTVMAPAVRPLVISRTAPIPSRVEPLPEGGGFVILPLEAPLPGGTLSSAILDEPAPIRTIRPQPNRQPAMAPVAPALTTEIITQPSGESFVRLAGISTGKRPTRSFQLHPPQANLPEPAAAPVASVLPKSPPPAIPQVYQVALEYMLDLTEPTASATQKLEQFLRRMGVHTHMVDVVIKAYTAPAPFGQTQGIAQRRIQNIVQQLGTATTVGRVSQLQLVGPPDAQRLELELRPRR